MQIERRRPYLLSDWRYAFGGRRRRVRHADGTPAAGVDHYGPRVLLLVLAISLLNALDAIFTLRLVEAGAAEEWNPFMRSLIENDVQLFANLKVALTSGALIFIVVCSKMTVLGHRLQVERLLHWFLAGYLALIGYHLVLLKLAGIS